MRILLLLSCLFNQSSLSLLGLPGLTGLETVRVSRIVIHPRFSHSRVVSFLVIRQELGSRVDADWFDILFGS